MRSLLFLMVLGLAACMPTHTPTSKIPNGFHTPLPNHSWLFYNLLPTQILDGKRVVTVEVLYRENFRRRPSTPPISIASQRLAAFQAARRTGRGMEEILVELATDVARRTDCPRGTLSLARETTHYLLPPEAWDGSLGVNQRLPVKEGEPIHIPSVKTHSAGGTVRLTCGEAARPTAAVSPAQLKTQISGRTHRAYSSQHGTQIEYLAANGLAYLWYPGNERAVVGRWSVEPYDRNPSAGVVCFSYQNAYNPVTGTAGARHCITAAQFNNTHRESRAGDPFNLSAGRVPYVLPKRNLSFDQL